MTTIIVLLILILLGILEIIREVKKTVTPLQALKIMKAEEDYRNTLEHIESKLLDQYDKKTISFEEKEEKFENLKDDAYKRYLNRLEDIKRERF